MTLTVCRFCLLVAVGGLQAVVSMDPARAGPSRQGLVRRVDGEPFQARLIGIDANQRLSLETPDGQRRSLKMDNVLMWGHPAEIERGPLVITRGGSWIRARGVIFDEDQFTIDSPFSDPLAVTSRNVRAIRFAPLGERDLRPVGSTASPVSEKQGDRVLLRNGDAFSGKITKLTVSSVHVTSSGIPLVIGRPRVSEAWFGVSIPVNRAEISTHLRPAILVGLRDGSLLRAETIDSENRVLSVTATQGVTWDGLSINDICYLQPIGGRVVYLSDLPVVEYNFRSYWGFPWPLKADRNVLGGRLRSLSGIYEKGLGTRSGAVATYAVDPRYNRFETELALDERCGVRGSVRIRIDLRKAEEWSPVYASGVLRGATEPESIAIGLDGATAIRLRVESADHGDAWDLTNWLNARFVR